MIPPHLAAEAKRLQAAGYAVMGIQLEWDTNKQQKSMSFKRNWQTAEPDTCLHLYFQQEDQGLAIVTGDKSDVFVVDLDIPKPQDIQEGFTNAVIHVQGLIDQYGLHPSVPTARTASGGMHLFFKLSSTLQAGLLSAANGVKCANMTLDCRGDRGCVICYPSVVPSPVGGKQYQWIQPIVPVVDLQPAPTWLIQLLNQRQKPAERNKRRKMLASFPDNDVFTYTVKEQMAKLAPARTVSTVWARNGGIDFCFNDMTCSCPLCGNTHTSNNYRARIILEDTFTLGNYSTSCRTQVLNWEACRLIMNLIGSPVTDDPFCHILKAVYDLQQRVICFTQAKRFLAFNGVVWKETNPQYIKQDIKLLNDQVIKPLLSNIPNTEQTAPKLKALTAARKYVEKAHNVNSILATFETLSFDGDIEECLDTDPDLLAVANGVVHLPTGKLQAGRDDHKLSIQLDTAFAPGPTPLIDNFFNDIFNGDAATISYMQRLLGYGITGHTRSQVWAIWTGPGSNGKSLLMGILVKLLGPFAVMMPGELLFECGKTTAGQSTPHLQTLIKKRMGFKDEGKSEKANVLNEELIKTVTGSSSITTKPLYKEYIEFRPSHLPILLCNRKPKLNNVLDEANLRRIVVVPFTNIYTSTGSKVNPYNPDNPHHRIRDDRLQERLETREGQQQLLVWLVAGAHAWYRTGLEPLPPRLSKAFDDYREENDLLAAFVAERCTVDGASSVNATAFLQAFNMFSATHVRQKTMKDMMASKGFAYATKGGMYKGIAMEEPDIFQPGDK